jgi:hypothetical protein
MLWQQPIDMPSCKSWPCAHSFAADTCDDVDSVIDRLSINLLLWVDKVVAIPHFLHFPGWQREHLLTIP